MGLTGVSPSFAEPSSFTYSSTLFPENKPILTVLTGCWRMGITILPYIGYVAMGIIYNLLDNRRKWYGHNRRNCHFSRKVGRCFPIGRRRDGMGHRSIWMGMVGVGILNLQRICHLSVNPEIYHSNVHPHIYICYGTFQLTRRQN